MRTAGGQQGPSSHFFRRLAILLSLHGLCSNCLEETSTLSPKHNNAHSMFRPKFVTFGDSLTQKACDPSGGWAAGLAHTYQRKVLDLNAMHVSRSRSAGHLLQVDVVSRGYSGYNTRWAGYLLDAVFPDDQADVRLVTLFWGANDAAIASRQRCCRLAQVHTLFGAL